MLVPRSRGATSSSRLLTSNRVMSTRALPGPPPACEFSGTKPRKGKLLRCGRCKMTWHCVRAPLAEPPSLLSCPAEQCPPARRLRCTSMEMLGHPTFHPTSDRGTSRSEPRGAGSDRSRALREMLLTWPSAVWPRLLVHQTKGLNLITCTQFSLPAGLRRITSTAERGVFAAAQLDTPEFRSFLCTETIRSIAAIPGV